MSLERSVQEQIVVQAREERVAELGGDSPQGGVKYALCSYDEMEGKD